MNENLTTKQRDWIYNYFYDVMSLDTFVGRVASLENFLTAHTAEDEPECDGSIFTKGCPKCESYLLQQKEWTEYQRACEGIPT